MTSNTLPGNSTNYRELATPLQHDQAPRLNRIQATSTRGVRACIRRVAGCATPTGSAGHAGAMANLKLTFQPDHSAGADQEPLRRQIRAISLPCLPPGADPLSLGGLLEGKREESCDADHTLVE